MTIMKRTISLIIVFALILGRLGITATFAATSGTLTETANSWLQPFTDYAAGDDIRVYTGNSATGAMVWSNGTAPDGVTFLQSPAVGVYGKTASDTAWKLHSNGTKTGGDEDTRPATATGPSGQVSLYTKTNGSTVLSAGGYLLFSMEIARNDSAMLNITGVRLNTNVGWTGSLFTVTNTGGVKVGATTLISAANMLNKWTRIDCVVYNSGGYVTADVYVNGDPATKATIATTTATSASINRIQLNSLTTNTTGGTGKYAVADGYWDNIYFGWNTAYPVISNPQPAHSDPGVEITNTAAVKTITAPGSLTVDAFKAGFSGTGVDTVSVVTADGTPQTESASLQSGWVNITDAVTGQKSYYTLTAGAGAEPATSLSVTKTGGELAQTTLTPSAVSFTASALPAGASLNAADVKWFVNSAEVVSAAGSLTFTYTPPATVGTYAVYAQIGSEPATKSTNIEIVMTPGTIPAATSLSVAKIAGELAQTTLAPSAVSFTAAALPVGSSLNAADVKWFVNSTEVVSAAGSLTFTYTPPATVGTYAVYAQIGSESATKSTNIEIVMTQGTIPAATSLSVTKTAGELTQPVAAVSAVTFAAAAVPVGAELNTADVKWFVNSAEVSTAAGSLTFSYTPPATLGTYTVCAQIGSDTSTRSTPISIQINAGSVRTSFRQNFDSLAANTAPAGMVINGLTNTYENAALSADDLAAARGITTTSGEMGVFGKPPFETAFMMRSKWNGTALPSGVSTAPSLEYTFSTAARAAMSGTEYFHMSFDYAVDGDYTNSVRGWFQDRWSDPVAGTTGTGGYSGSSQFLTSTNTGATSLFGNSVFTTMPKQKWEHFDYIIKPSDSTYNVYVDGVAKFASFQPFDAYNQVAGQQLFLAPWYIRFNFDIAANWAKDAKSYVDNWGFEITTIPPQIAPLSFAHSDTTINGYIDAGSKRITIPSAANLTVSQLTSGLSGAGFGYAEIKTGDGVVESGENAIQNGDWLCVTTTGKSIEYYPIKIFVPKDYINQKFTESAAAAGIPGASYTIYSMPPAKIDAMPNDAANTFENQFGLGGRAIGDQSLVMKTTSAVLGKDPMLNVDFGEQITEPVVVEASVLARSGAENYALQIPINNDTSTMKDLLRFNKDGTLTVNGVSAGKWTADRWYKVAAVMKVESAKWDVYVNGKKIIDDQPFKDASTVINSVWRFKLAATYAAGANGFVAVDDFRVYNSNYSPTDDLITVAAKAGSGLVADATGKVIYLDAAQTKEQLLGKLDVSANTVSTAVYTDTALSAVKSGGDLATGDFIAFTSQSGVIEVYGVQIITGVVGIQSAKYTFSNTNHTILAPVKTIASDFYNNITLYPIHTGQLVYKATGEPVSANYVIGLNSDTEVVYRVTAVGTDVDYALVNKHYWFTFDNFVGKTFNNGSSFENLSFNIAGSGSVVQGETDADGNAVMHFSVASGVGGNTGFRKSGMTALSESNTMVFGIDVKINNLARQNKITLVSNNATKYWDMFYWNADGSMQFSGNSVGTYRAGEWVKLLVAMDLTTTDVRVFVDGVQKYAGKNANLSGVPYFHDLIYAIVDGAVQESYADNFVLYPISSVADFDENDLKSAVTSTKVVVGDDKVISGYGNTTVGVFLSDLITVPTGAAATVYAPDGSTADAGDTLVKGMKLVLNAKYPGYSTTYTIGEVADASINIKIDGKNVNIVYPGAASASADFYTQDAQQVQLVFGYYKGGSLVEEKTSQLVTTTAGQRSTLTAALATAMPDTLGDVLQAKLVKADGTTLWIEEKVVSYSDALELGTTIALAKDDRKGILTLTMDDGYINSARDWFEPMFEKHGISGTTVGIYNSFGSGSASANALTDAFKNFIPKGHMQVDSHSYTHGVNSTLVGFTEAQLEHEFKDSRDAFRALFPGQDVLTLTWPGNAYNATMTNQAKLYYGATRGGQTEGNTSLSSITSTDNLYNLNLRRVGGGSSTTDPDAPKKGTQAVTMNGWITDAVTNGGWVVEMVHAMAWQKDTGYYSEGGYLPMDGGIYEQHYAYAAQLQNEGKLWVATFSDATKYQWERLHATLVDNATRTSRTLMLTDDLDNDIYNYPVTLISEVPATWTYVTVTQGAHVQTIAAKEDNGKYYVTYEAVPDRGEIVLEQSLTAPTSGEITTLTVSTDDNLSGLASDRTPVTFKVTAEGTGTPYLGNVEWIVNSTRRPGDGDTFTYGFYQAGTYGIVAKVQTPNGPIYSEPFMVNVIKSGVNMSWQSSITGTLSPEFDDTKTDYVFKITDSTVAELPVFTAQIPNSATVSYQQATKLGDTAHITVTIAGVSKTYNILIAGNISNFDLGPEIKALGYTVNQSQIQDNLQPNISKPYSGGITEPMPTYGEMTDSLIGSSFIATNMGATAGGVQLRINEITYDVPGSGAGKETTSKTYYKFNINAPAMVYFAQPGPTEASTFMEFPNYESAGWTKVGAFASYNNNKDGFLTGIHNGSFIGYRIESPVSTQYAASVLTVYAKYCQPGEVIIPTFGVYWAHWRSPQIIVDWNEPDPSASYDPITDVSITAEGNLDQTIGQTQDVVFTAVTTPNDNVNLENLIWSVNGVQAGTGRTFTLSPEATGSYAITLGVNGTELTAGPKTVTVSNYGDVSGDGVIDISDVIMAAEIAVGADAYTLAQETRANVSSKTESIVDISDVVMIAERAVGGTTAFPIELP